MQVQKLDTLQNKPSTGSTNIAQNALSCQLLVKARLLVFHDLLHWESIPSKPPKLSLFSGEEPTPKYEVSFGQWIF